MNHPRLAFLALCLSAAVLPAHAALQSAKLNADCPMPAYPAVLVGEGITHGVVLVGVSIDEAGRITDSIVLGYTNQRLVRPTQEAMKEWRFAPARLDGEPVPVQTELRIDYSLTGAVITTNILNHFFYDHFEHLGDNAWVMEPGRADALDAVPARTSGDAPRYALGAAQQGVHGRVNVRFYIDEAGNVRLPAITAPVHPYLAEQAVSAVRSWKFEPAKRHGRPVIVAAQQEFAFNGDR